MAYRRHGAPTHHRRLDEDWVETDLIGPDEDGAPADVVGLDFTARLVFLRAIDAANGRYAPG
ncbi:hypothetical protein [Chenggangzhangella methanolivorans]|uniref:Uncharacterized protein n=1 Tax=Chenggangzhangella methanolivorans TaxID=1437009 RepID=A0A9E6UKU6_9HYPH|nr:hypothetical protein [Chenggangzhangella methanolivorans]QZN99806.1 hypothetical protein K6K41_24605 [Chenggangzhangella methanolivorans]